MAKSQKGVKGFVGGDEGSLSLGSEAWNVADGYTKLKILKQLILLDRFENIALYGVDDMDEEMFFDQNSLNKRRSIALDRYATTLRQLLGNVRFAIRVDDHPKITKFLEDIAEVQQYMDGISYVEVNQITHENNLVINEEHMKNCLSVLQLIKDEINFPINKAGLIFRGSDEIDLDKIMQEITEGG